MRYPLWTFLIFILYLLGMTALMIWQGVGISPDRYAIVLLLGSLVIKRTRAFLIDWLPFLLILISYDFLRGIADEVANRVNITSIIQADLSMFGVIPSVFLQQHFYTPGHLHWYDFLAAILYFLHFALPLAFGFLLWMNNRAQFRLFTLGLLLLSYAAFITYVLFPAAPPWWAQKEGYFTGMHKILDDMLTFFPNRWDLPTIYHQINPNPVAAVPSLHAAYPLLILLFGLRFFKQKAWWFVPYVLSIWIAVVYLGEHYVIDVIIGALYAIVFFFLSIYLEKQLPSVSLRLQKRLSRSSVAKRLLSSVELQAWLRTTDKHLD